MMHAASLHSPRLKRALAALREFPGGLTTRQWIEAADICACNSIASELRACGIPVECLHEGKKNGANVFRYKLKESV